MSLSPSGNSQNKSTVATSMSIATIVVAIGCMSFLYRESVRAGNGMSELTLATSMVDLFRSDVRQAVDAQIADGSKLTLQMHWGVVKYQRNPDGRMERTIEGQPALIGPQMTSVAFSIHEIDKDTRFRLLQTQWLCTADSRLLLLDTVIRRETNPEVESSTGEPKP